MTDTPHRSKESQFRRDIQCLERRADWLASRAANKPPGSDRQRDEQELGALLRIIARVRDTMPIM